MDGEFTGIGLVKSLVGDVPADGVVWHVFAVANGLIERMDLTEGDAGSGETAAAAFARR